MDQETTHNVINLKNIPELKDQRKFNQLYKNYLRSLNDEQIHKEVCGIIQDSKKVHSLAPIQNKATCLMDILSERVLPQHQHLIETLKNELLNRPSL